MSPFQFMSHVTGQLLSRFTKSAGCIISEGVSKETVAKAADTSKVKIRGKFDVFAESLQREEVPLLVFSAGVGQIIERVSSCETQGNVLYLKLRIQTVCCCIIFSEKSFSVRQKLTNTNTFSLSHKFEIDRNKHPKIL